MLLYLPPYSPDFNPIEASFKGLKTSVRRHCQYTGGGEISEVFIAFLEEAAEIRGNLEESVAGHYLQACVTVREGWNESMEVNYLDIYAENLARREDGLPR